jgi:hypothetical protein
MKSYLSMREELAVVSSQLRSFEQSNFWSMENVGKALWTAAMLSIYDTDSLRSESVDTGNLSGRKRSRDPKGSLTTHQAQEQELEGEEEKEEKKLEESKEPVEVIGREELKRTLSGRIRKDVERYG